MRNPYNRIHTTEGLESFTDARGRRWYAMTVYPRGKADKAFWTINLFRVGAGHGETYASAEAYLQRKQSLTQRHLF